LFASWGLYNDWPRMCTIIPQSMDSFRASLDSLVQLLDDGGMMVFGEPNYESWSYIITLLRGVLREYSYQHKAAGKAGLVFSHETTEKLVKFIRSLELRFSKRDDVDFLSKLEDKHVFSVAGLMAYAQKRNLRLLVENSGKDYFDTVFEKIETQLVTENDKRIFKEYFDDVVPSGISESILGEPFMVFSLHV
ncbi:MAG: hypothetical protein KZQ65_03770, partial [Candidatus Thiodiazotropha sp. (ex Gloverina cf. vestifex)]|nr:hypothetical protein [Candidatus Thiodiazotropha sp. (ex Gloverina cf. vestifex)]